VQQLKAMGVATCLDHVIVFNEAVLAGEISRHLQSFGSWIIAAETTRAYRRTNLTPRPVQLQDPAGSSPVEKSVDLIIVTNVVPPD